MTENPRGRVAHLLRQPLLHFLVIGVVVGSVATWRRDSTSEPSDRTVQIPASGVERLATEWQMRWNRAPTTDELNGAVRAYVRESVLYREALAMGLDRDNPVIRRLLVRNLETMARELAELSLSPTDQDLAAFFEDNAARYRPKPLITFTHVFVNPDRRGDSTLDDAAKMLAELEILEPSSEIAQKIGDTFMLPRQYREEPETQVARLFGREFAKSVFALEADRWHGPILSGYGTHLVYVEGVQRFPLPDFEDVKDRLTQDWVDENCQEITEKYFADTVARYKVVVGGEPWSADGDPSSSEKK